MKNRVYKYFFYEFISYFTVVLFALTAIIWTIQAVNYLDLVTDDGHAFFIYLFYSLLSIPKILTKLIPFSFLLASMLTLLKLDRENELIILWTSGLNKIHIVNLMFRISLLIMFMQFLLSCFITPETLNYSRSVLKGSQLQFVPSLLKEKQFNDTVEGLTIFVEKKNNDGVYNNIFIRDDSNVLTKVSSGSSTIFAKKGFVSKDENNLILLEGNIQKLDGDGSISVVTFGQTQLNLSGISTKTISEPKLQETSTLEIIECMKKENFSKHNCSHHKEEHKDAMIELNKRFGVPLFIPLISLIACFMLSSRKDKEIIGFNKYIYFVLGFIILVLSEILVRYSGISTQNTIIYYLFPIGFLPIIYIFLMNKFKYENLY